MTKVKTFLLAFLPILCLAETTVIKTEHTQKELIVTLGKNCNMFIPLGSKIETFNDTDSTSFDGVKASRITLADSTTLHHQFQSKPYSYHLSKNSVVTLHHSDHRAFDVTLAGELTIPQYKMHFYKGTTFRVLLNGTIRSFHSPEQEAVVFGLPLVRDSRGYDDMQTVRDTVYDGFNIPAKTYCSFTTKSSGTYRLDQLRLGGSTRINGRSVAKGCRVRFLSDSRFSTNDEVITKRIPRKSNMEFDRSGNLRYHSRKRNFKYMPSCAVGGGFGFSRSEVDFHFDGKVGVYMIPRRMEIGFNPNLGYQHTFRDEGSETIFSAGNYFTYFGHDGWVGVLAGADVLYSPYSEEKVGYRISVKGGLLYSPWVEIAFQNCTRPELLLSLYCNFGLLFMQ